MPDSSDAPKPIVAVWRWTWLPGSETFIRNQMAAMQTWTPCPIGAVRVDSPLSAMSDRIVFATNFWGRVRERMFWYTFRSRAVSREISSSGAVVLHAHFAYDGFRVLPAAKKLGIPLVVTLHGVDVTANARQPGLKGWAYRRNLKRLFARADQLLAVSGFIREQAIGLGAAASKVKVSHIGIPLDNELEPDSPGQARTDIAFVGRLVEKKGVDDLLRAAHLAGPTVTVCIAGDGPLRPELEALADALQVKATFVGHVSPQRVAKILDSATMYAAPSKTSASGDTEGLPTVVMEAGRHGLPTVGYRHAGIPEAVSEETGVLVAEHDVEGLAAAIKLLRDDEELRLRMGAAARARVAEHFAIDRCTRALEDVYDTASGRRGAAAEGSGV